MSADETSEQPRRRPGIRRAIIVIPSAFTLSNLFFGIWAMVSAAQGNFTWAGWFIVFAGVADVLDGRMARMSHTGTRFGAELDSLVDVISFGVAPAMLMYFLEFAEAGKFAWVLCFIYVAAVAVRLARYNITAAGAAKPGWFSGLPSPAAGMTLATYYAFSQTQWYQRFPEYLDLQRQGLTFLMLALSAMMLSNVKYPRTPRIGLRSLSGILGTLVTLGIVIGVVFAPSTFLFPFGIGYLLFGITRSSLIALSERAEDPAEAQTLHLRPHSGHDHNEDTTP
ncbi:MAG: CDP-diacylglycerol--serine O-phosphatidyltransferase [Gammaproteobacteria bacterium]|jgi:CDP-diacylglycerol--serine O-phosphatidyltransferase|nr:CDP-diacylglycerol--serine O-phosphatidyltransferase [Gammaproteobacteria bacterium]